MPGVKTTRSHRLQQWVVVIGIFTLSLNLRPAAVSVGPVLKEITAGLSMSAFSAGVLTALPVLAFATVGAVTPRLAQRMGAHRLTLTAIGFVIAGLVLRASSSNTSTFLLWSFIALAGAASVNVLMPSLVKLHFPHRIGSITGLYTTSMAVGLTLASTLTVPIARWGHTDGQLDWRRGLAVWAIAGVVAAIPWMVLLRHDRSVKRQRSAISLPDIARTRLGLLMAAFFGLQSLQAYSAFGWLAQIYRDAGYSAEAAGIFLGIATAVGIPLSFVVPILATRSPQSIWLIVALMTCYPVALLGLMVAPSAAPWVWALVLGTGMTTFPLILTLINLRARTTEGTAALSGFTQSAGYLLASLGPIGVGALYDLTGAWTAPLLMLIGLSILQFFAGIAVTRAGDIEDQLPHYQG